MRTIRFITNVFVGVSLSSAAPLNHDAASSGALEPRIQTTRDDLVDGQSSDCPDIILIYARGSGEAGNMGTSVGPALSDSLEDTYGGMWVQGVGGAYTAGFPANLLPDGTTQGAIDEAKSLFTMAYEKCRNSVVLTGGYSQGAAVIGGALTQLKDEPDVQDQVAGAVLFGDTMSYQNGGRIPEFPEQKTREYCETLDLLCHGTLILLPTHIFYMDDAAIAAPIFLKGRVDAATQSG